MRRSTRLLVVVVLALGLTLAAVGAAYAITNGTPDGNGHPYVGLVVFDDAPGHPAWRCSGTLLSPTVFLTAGHCTDGAVAARVWFESHVTDSHYPFGGGTSIASAEIHTAPGFCVGCMPGLPGFDTHDVGVVILSTPVTTVGHGALPAQGLVNTLGMKTPVMPVGYGVQTEVRGGGPPVWTGTLIRYFAQSLLIQSNNVQSVEYLKLTANPGQGKGGTCFGDSGGPVFLGSSNTVLGVNSYVTNGNCTGVTYSNRIDLGYAVTFINSFMP